MAFSIDAIKAGLPNGGFRPTLFEVIVPDAGGLQLTCQSSQVPSITTGVVEVPYFGRKIKFAGDRTYADWTTTAFIDEGFTARKELEAWTQKINDPAGNTRSGGPDSYKRDVDITLFTKTGGTAAKYKLIGAWPSDVGTIELDWGTNDTIGTYTVTWAFDYME